MARPKKRSSKARPVTRARVVVSGPRDKAARARARLKAAEKRERENQLAWEETVKADQTRRRSLAQSVEGKLYLALEAMQERVFNDYPSLLTTRRPQSSYDSEYEAGVKVTTDQGKKNRRNWRGGFVWKSPWALIGRIAFRSLSVGYADLYSILSSWDSSTIERRVDGDRFARIRVEYIDASTGETGEYTLSETFAWKYGIRRAISECDPDRARSLAGRYKESRVTAVIIWFSSSTQREQTTFTKRRP